MFPTSSQKSHWIFSDEDKLKKLREKANNEFIQRNCDKFNYLSDAEKENFFLTPDEEHSLLIYFVLKMKEFCETFQPPMPLNVLGTAYHYIKRFYLNNSVMDYNPEDILITCVYLSCKVEEFNVSLAQFVGNLKGDENQMTDIVLNYEFLLMQQLNYQLRIHNPYKPIEGLLLDLKVRSSLKNVDRLRSKAYDFINRIFVTDACLLYSPAQLALAAVLHSASQYRENLDLYVTETLVEKNENATKLLITSVRNIRTSFSKIHDVNVNVIKSIKQKLKKCQNEEFRPGSEAYKRKILETAFDEHENFDICGKKK